AALIVRAQDRLHELRQLRVGYVSADFKRHPVAQFMEPILRSHDEGGFEIICYNSTIKPDATTDRLASLVPRWETVTDLSDDQLAQKIADDEVDILVDLAGHTSHTRLA